MVLMGPTGAWSIDMFTTRTDDTCSFHARPTLILERKRRLSEIIIVLKPAERKYCEENRYLMILWSNYGGRIMEVV